MSDNKRPTEVVIPNNGRMWTSVDEASRVWCMRQSQQEAANDAEYRRQCLASARDLLRQAGVSTGDNLPVVHVVELHVQTAEARAEQMRRLAKVIADAEFDTSYEKAYIAGEIAEILGLDERWVNLATGVDPDECRDATEGPCTLGDVSDE